MIQSADVSIRASKLLNDKTLLQGIFQWSIQKNMKIG
jgi:hypothetical protein